jgi:hypothetical protein
MSTTQLRPGKRYRVTLLKDIETTHDDTRAVVAKHGRYVGERPGHTRLDVPTMVTPAGTVYEGYVSALDGSFFNLTLPDGTIVGFYVDDPGIRLEAL